MRIVLAYSGGLDTSVILAWLRERYGADVIAYTADIGQEEDLDAVEEKARRTGASEFIREDLREVFARDYVFPMLRADAIYEGSYLLGTSIARPLIARRLVAIARDRGADAVAHGATGKGNDQVRFEITAYALDPDIRIIAPWREWDLRSRADLIAYAKARDIPIPVTAERPYSIDRNLLHTSFEGGILEDPWREPPEEMFERTRAAKDAPDEPHIATIGFEGGDPASVDGRPLAPHDLIARLNVLAGEHGIGRADVVENRFVGMKSRGVYETPGGTVLHAAHRALQGLVLDREVMRLRDGWVPKYAELVYDGFWFAPEREALQAAIDRTESDVTGEVRLRLFKGAATVLGRRSPRSLYDPALATFEEGSGYDQADATGFIRLNALRLRVRARRDGAVENPSHDA
ncbi:MAG: argininosuccinate synthase [Planctomycetes bacterium]|nr:argininosuccinate synthase [Planctomycetota bacterium]